ncbi:MAG: glucan biosynthesis protein, partial [Pseudomonas sp.]|nr:glucan biosynthesis protein [Pseudomonas sp.]
RSTGDVKQSNLIRQPDGSVAYLVHFEGPSLKALPEDAPVRSQVSVGDNAELVENSVRYNPETQGWRLTLRMKIKDPSKSTEMRAALVQNIAAPEPVRASAATANSSVAKAEKIAARQQEKQEKQEKQKKEQDAKQPAAAEATPATLESVKTEQVLTETWSYQLPADE